MWASSWPERAAGRRARRLAAGAVLAGVLIALAPVLPATAAQAGVTPPSGGRPTVGTPAGPAGGTPSQGTPSPAGTRSAAGPPAAAAQAPPGTVTRTDQYLTDAQGRVLLPHGLMLPAGTVPADTDLDAWAGAGLSAIGVTVALAAGGGFPDPHAGAGAATAGDPGLAQAAAVVRALTNRGFRVVLRVVPAPTGAEAPAAALTAAVGRLATAFRGTGGLIGYQLTAAEAARAPGAANAVVAADPVHLLWRERPAPFDPTATVAVNDPAGYLTDWAGSGDGAVAAFTAAADGNQIGWLYPAQAGGQNGTAAFPGALARPYPVAVAGEVSQFGLDGTGTFTLRYSTSLAVGRQAPDGLLTAVSLPPAAFPTGYRVQVTGARALTPPGSALLCLAAEPGATAVSLTVTRDPAGRPPAPQRIAGAQACPAAAPSPAAGTPAAAPAGDGAAKDEAASALLWALPLLGAAVMALLLAVPFLRLRRMRAASGGSQSGPGDDDRDDLAADDLAAGSRAADSQGTQTGESSDGLAPLVAADTPTARPPADGPGTGGRHRAGRR